jgi:hypothetical protein
MISIIKFAANKGATEPRFPCGKVEGITSTVLQLLPSLGKPLRNICVTNDHFLVLSSFMAYHRVFNNNSSMGATGGELPVFRVVRVARSLIFCVVFCRSSFIVFLLTIVHCLSFFDLRFLITPLVSSNSSLNNIK